MEYLPQISDFYDQKKSDSQLLKVKFNLMITYSVIYSETLNNEYIERIHEMSYSSLSDIGMLQIFSFLIK